MIDRLRKKFTTQLALLDSHTLEVLKKSTSSTIVKIIGMAIGVSVSIFLGKTLGADGLGIIHLSQQIISILIIISLLGLRQVIVKEIAIAYDKKDWIHVGNVMHTSYILIGIITVLLTIIMILLSPLLIKYFFHEPRLKWPLIIALITMTPQVFSRIFSSALIGYKKIWQSNLVDHTLSLAIVSIILLFIWFAGHKITVVNTAIAYGLGRLVVTFSIGIYWNKLSKLNTLKTYIPKKLLKTAKPLLIVSITSIIAANSDVIMLGWLGNTKMVGLYSVAVRIALLTSFFLQVTNAAVSPKIAALFDAGKVFEMEKMVRVVTKGLFLIGASAFLVFVLFGNQLLSLWGDEFKDAYFLLIILSFGQLFNIGTGASGIILVMCGLEKYHAWISSIFIVFNIILNVILIKQYGSLGAAIATSLTVILDNLSRIIVIRIKLNIWTLPIKIKR